MSRPRVPNRATLLASLLFGVAAWLSSGVLTVSASQSTVTVPAIAQSGVAGPTIRVGQLVQISATGTWCMGGTQPTAECGGPAGIRWANFDEPDVVDPSAKLGALIGRVGSGPWSTSVRARNAATGAPCTQFCTHLGRTVRDSADALHAQWTAGPRSQARS